MIQIPYQVLTSCLVMGGGLWSGDVISKSGSAVIGWTASPSLSCSGLQTRWLHFIGSLGNLILSTGSLGVLLLQQVGRMLRSLGKEVLQRDVVETVACWIRNAQLQGLPSDLDL